MAVYIHSEAELQRIGAAARVAKAAQAEAARLVELGHDFVDVDARIASFIADQGGRPAFAGYKGFPNAGAIFSVNEQVCNAVVTPRRAREGDILSIAVAVELDGMHAKSEETYCVGEVEPVPGALVDTAYKILELVLRSAPAGMRLGDIGAFIQKMAETLGFRVIEAFCGHGIGRELHMQPQVSGTGRAGTGMRLKQNMVLYIMVMLAERDPNVVILEDGWTAVTRDNGLAATAARMVVIDEEGAIQLPDGLDSDAPETLVRPRLQAPPPGEVAGADTGDACEEPKRPWYRRLFGE